MDVLSGNSERRARGSGERVLVKLLVKLYQLAGPQDPHGKR